MMHYMGVQSGERTPNCQTLYHFLDELELFRSAMRWVHMIEVNRRSCFAYRAIMIARTPGYGDIWNIWLMKKNDETNGTTFVAIERLRLIEMANVGRTATPSPYLRIGLKVSTMGQRINMRNGCAHFKYVFDFSRAIFTSWHKRYCIHIEIGLQIIKSKRIFRWMFNEWKLLRKV